MNRTETSYTFRSVFFTDKPIVILIATWVGVQYYVLQHYGVVSAPDSPMYIEDAYHILQGHLPEGRGIWYIGYSSFLSGVFLLKGNLSTIVFLQMLLSGLAALALFHLVSHLSDKRSAIIAVFLYLTWIKIHQWNVYIYTESLFTSCCIFSFASLTLSRKGWHYFLTSILITFTFFIRPTGIGLMVAVFGYLVTWIAQKNKIPVSVWIILSGILITASLMMINYILKDYIYYFIDSYSKAEIIYPSIPLFLQKPEQLTIASSAYTPVVQLVLFFLYNPVYFIKLCLLKLFLFFGNIKPYFSWYHNALIIAVLYPCYIFAAYGYKNMTAAKEKIFIGCFIISQALIVSLTSENWDGRFLIPVLPFVFIYSAIGVNHVLKK
ncbi:MAG TPA: hypothetical protein VK750_06645 [Cytophagaceae bacterium]|jgi:hypothetical protein|nr:hypothetical protein [Cytophagaceae bacterium]